jgi:hypothetical protein
MNLTTHFRDFAKCRKEVPEPLGCDAGTKCAEGGLARAFYRNRGNKARMSMKTKEEVNKSSRRGVQSQVTTSTVGPLAGRPRAAPRLLDSSTFRLQNSTNDPGMYMKTKEEVKKSGSRGVEESRSDGSATKFGEKVHRRPAGQLPDSRLSTLDSQLSRGTKRECL